jgi:hypothetical protein
MPPRPPTAAYYHPRAVRRIKVNRGAAALRLRKRLERLKLWFGQRERSDNEKVMYEKLVAAMEECIAEADRKANRIDQRLRESKNLMGRRC